jgi:hypothetical protein
LAARSGGWKSKIGAEQGQNLAMVAKLPCEGGLSESKLTTDLQELLKKLVLKDEELDDVVLPDTSKTYVLSRTLLLLFLL